MGSDFYIQFNHSIIPYLLMDSIFYKWKHLLSHHYQAVKN